MHREIEITVTNSSGVELGKGVFHSVLQSLYYNILDMHKLTPNIQEVMAFPMWLSVKQNLRKLPVWNLCCIALFRPLKQMLT
jgi:hypothetical protein